MVLGGKGSQKSSGNKVGVRVRACDVATEVETRIT